MVIAAVNGGVDVSPVYRIFGRNKTVGHHNADRGYMLESGNVRGVVNEMQKNIEESTVAMALGGAAGGSGAQSTSWQNDSSYVDPATGTVGPVSYTHLTLPTILRV